MPLKIEQMPPRPHTSSSVFTTPNLGWVLFGPDQEVARRGSSFCFVTQLSPGTSLTP